MCNEITMHHHDRKTTGQRTEMNVETGGMAQTGNISYNALNMSLGQHALWALLKKNSESYNSSE